MANKHYYIEDIDVDPMRADRIKPVKSIQFNGLPESKSVFINIDQPDGKKLIRASVVVPLDELRQMYEWLSGMILSESDVDKIMLFPWKKEGWVSKEAYEKYLEKEKLAKEKPPAPANG